MLKKRTIHRFTANDDDIILRIVNKHEGDIVSSIPKILEEIGENHSKRSIIDRYKLFLTQERSDWTKEQDKMLMEACRNFKKRWSIVAKFFENRSADQVKIRFHQLSQDQIKKKRQQRAEAKKLKNSTATKEKNTTVDENEIWDIINKDFENHFNDIFD